jgi:hypothetical protein
VKEGHARLSGGLEVYLKAGLKCEEVADIFDSEISARAP